MDEEDEEDIVIRLRRAWADPTSLSDREIFTLLRQAITEIEMLRLMQDERKVRGVYEALVGGTKKREE